MIAPSLSTIKSLWFKTEYERRMADLESDLYTPAYVLLTAQKHGRLPYRDFCIQFTELLRHKFSLINYSWSEPARKQVLDEMKRWLSGVSNEDKLLVLITRDLEDVQQFVNHSTKLGKLLDSLDAWRLVYVFLYFCLGVLLIPLLYVKISLHDNSLILTGLIILDLFFIMGLATLDRFGAKRILRLLIRKTG